MGLPRPFLRAALVAASVSALVASGLAGAESASADPANPTPVSSTALPTAQVNGVVWSQTVSNGVDYVGGSFNQSQPAGAAAGVGVTPRSNLFAYDVASGAAIGGFNATANAQVRGIAASPDGSRIYIVGDFTVVNGQPRYHIAALDPSGNLIAGFAPNVNGYAYSVVARGDDVYFGGSFTSVNGSTRARAAEVTTAGVVLPFAPSVADNTVRAVALSPDGTQVLLGGNFTNVGGLGYNGLAAVDSTTGVIQDWMADQVVKDSGNQSSIYSLTTRGSVVYATGYVYGVGGNLEGAVAMNWGNGSIKWIEDCHGDSYSSTAFNDALYVVSHAHDCSNVVGGWSSPGTPSQWRRAQAFSQSAMGVLQHNTQDNYADFGGQPSPALVAGWSPTINTGTYTGADQGAWSAASGGSYLVLGGEFTQVNGQRQTGLVRFQGQPESPDGVVAAPPTTTTPPPTTTPPTTTPSATVPNRVSKPRIAVLGPSAIAAAWSAPKAAAVDKVTGYVVKAYQGSKVVKTITVGATKRLAVITGLRRSTTYRVGVAAKNAKGSGQLSITVSARTHATGKNVSATKHPSKVGKPTTSISTTRIRARWSAASTSGALGVSGYQVRVVLHGKVVKTFTVSAKSRMELITGLKRHTSYQLSVRAENWAGWGSWSTARSAGTH